MAEAADPLGDVRRALVIGVGASGLAAVRALVEAGVHVVVSDDREDAEGFEAAEQMGAERAGRAAAQVVGDVDLLVPSPGVPERAPPVAAALEHGVPVWSEPELGWRLHPRQVLGVTGTNGKTSTTELLTAMLKAAGVDARSCGNIGRPFTEVAAASDEATTLVAELSSFQLRFCHTLRPTVGVLLNLAPDHLDWHRTLDADGRAKARLWQAQRAGDWAVVNADDPRTRELAAVYAPQQVATFTVTDAPSEAAAWVQVVSGELVSHVPGAGGPLLELTQLPLSAPHHVSNTAAAALAALLVGADPDAVRAAASTFRPGAHRVQQVAERDGIVWVDDSKATNPHAAAAALSAYPSIVWLAGGLSKGVDLSVLADHLGAVRHAVLIGEAARELAEVCSACEVPSVRAGSMQEAVESAARLAQPGDTVLLAPACASFDMFRDYADRGDRYAAAVRRLVGGHA